MSMFSFNPQPEKLVSQNVALFLKVSQTDERDCASLCFNPVMDRHIVQVLLCFAPNACQAPAIQRK